MSTTWAKDGGVAHLFRDGGDWSRGRGMLRDSHGGVIELMFIAPSNSLPSACPRVGTSVQRASVWAARGVVLVGVTATKGSVYNLSVGREVSSVGNKSVVYYHHYRFIRGEVPARAPRQKMGFAGVAGPPSDAFGSAWVRFGFALRIGVFFRFAPRADPPAGGAAATFAGGTVFPSNRV